MMSQQNIVFLFVELLSFFSLHGQVGINNPSANATLEITAKKTDGSRSEGLIYPRLSGEALYQADQNGVYGRNQDGVMAFVTAAPSPEKRVRQTIDIDARGYYYYDYPANKWIKVCGSSSAAAKILNFNCTGVIRKGTLTHGTAASAVSFELPYNEGNGANYNAQEIVSAGVTGLKATLPAGTIAIGSGTLPFTISGTPGSAGTAKFIIDFGGKRCEITMEVAANSNPIVNGINCGQGTRTGQLIHGETPAGVTFSIPYTDGNGADYPAQTLYASAGGPQNLAAVLAAGTLAHGAGQLIYTITQTPYGAGDYKFMIDFGGKSCEFKMPVGIRPPPIIVQDLNCANTEKTNVIIIGTSVSGVSFRIPYQNGPGSQGVGQTYGSMEIPSTGVTGLIATLQSDRFNPGGYLTYTVSGTLSGSGTASFAINFGGKSCTITLPVNPPAAVAHLNCAGATVSGSMLSGNAVTGASVVLPYTGGNGGNYFTQTVASTGVTGLTATLLAGTISTNGNLTLTISGTPNSAGEAIFPVSFGGKSCEVKVLVGLGARVNSLDCNGGARSGTLVRGTPASGVSFHIPYTGGNGGRYPTQTVSSGFGLTATLAAGTIASGGNLTYTVSGTSQIYGTASFPVSFGERSCTANMTVENIPVVVDGLNCGAGVTTGRLIRKVPASAVSFKIPFTGGNNGSYPPQSILSAGVTGLTATLTEVKYPGSGSNERSLIYTISGTPASAGTAHFSISFGGKSCSFATRVDVS